MISPALVLSLGEPAGIGPEIVVKAWRSLQKTGPAFVVVGDATLLTSVAGDASPVRRASDFSQGAAMFANALPVIDIPIRKPALPGVVSLCNPR